MPTDKLLHFLCSFLASLINPWLAVATAESEVLEAMLEQIVGEA